jgi:CheY-like chemotaxis protein
MKNISILYLHGECYSELTFDILEKEDKTIRRIAFPPNSSESIDQVYHNQLKRILNKSFDLIITELNYNENDFLDFSGLRVAMHVRLTPKFNNQKTPILVLGFASFEDIIRLESCNNSFLGSILGTPGLKLSHDIKLENILPSSNLCEKDFQHVLKKIKIDPPPNYDHRHSVANEYAIYSWSKAIGLENEKIEEELGSRLYFKYLDCVIQKNHIGPLDISTLKIEVTEEAKILLIDDEAEKGWGQFYKELLGANLILKVAEIDYSKNSVSILDQAIESIQDFDPDIVLLDLRLSDDDIGKTSDLTGIEIIKKLNIEEGTNKGIRIIITSASNKVWNYLDAGIRNSDLLEGVILKSNHRNFDKHPIINMLEIIELALPRAQHLKKLYRLIKDIEKKLDILDSQYLTNIGLRFDVLFTLCRLGIDEPRFQNHAYIEIYKIIEGLLKQDSIFFEDKNNNIYITGNSKNCLVAQKKIDNIYETNYGFSKTKNKYCVGNNEISRRTNKPFETDLICKFVLFYRYQGMFITQWVKLNTLRNEKAVHEGKIINEVISSKEITDLLIFLQFIVDKKNISEKNFEFGLKKASSIISIKIEKSPSTDYEYETYSQELIVISSTTEKKSQIIINKQSFELVMSPQIIELKNMVSDGRPVDINATIQGEEERVFPEVFRAPKSKEKKLSERDKIKEAKKKHRESLNNDETN